MAGALTKRAAFARMGMVYSRLVNFLRMMKILQSSEILLFI